MPNRQGDSIEEPIYTALGRALSAWEGVNAAVNNLFHALNAHLDQDELKIATAAFYEKFKTHDRADELRRAGALFVSSDFGEKHAEAASFKKRLKQILIRYLGWVERRNELAHGYVTMARSPDYSHDDQPTINVYALLPSHARTDRWYNSEPGWNYLAAEIEEFARQFTYLDVALEEMANKAVELNKSRTSAE